ncbi:hypothetical protein PsorP6_017293 [Peronosclerospora sorghi]|uniref:Uncharacterized protein n=1 Tax=Peronosclerospora sorghi TaxID=230839 RepID=A0ACC0WKS4_9STRA|nr:hypothetical protein PsorP6_017293 [Peronosclerospora sorghi]
MHRATWLNLINLYLGRKVPHSVLEQMHKNDESPQSAFARLGLTEAKAPLFENPRFHQWIAYVNEHQHVPAETIRTLSTHFHDDAKLYKILDEAKGHDEFTALATRLEADLFDYWVTEKKEPAQVFDLLQLSTQEHATLTPTFLQWMTYVKKYSAHHSDGEKLAIETLTSNFELDLPPYKILEKVKKVQGYEEVATWLLAALLGHWATSRKDPEKVLYVLGLPTQMHRKDLFEYPKFQEWVAYVDTLNAKHPETPVSMIPTLTRHLEGPHLLDQIDRAKKEKEASRKLAMRIESDFYDNLTEGTIAADILSKIGLSVPHRLQDRRYLLRLKRLLHECDGKDSSKEKTIYHALTSKFHARDVVACIVHLKKARLGIERMAERLESELREWWLAQGKTIADVYSMVGVSKRVQNVHVWLSYCNLMVEHSPSELSTMSSFLKTVRGLKRKFIILEAAKRFPNIKDVALTLQTEEVQGVFQRKVHSPRTLFELFGFAHDENVLGNSLFPKWLEYLKQYNQENPKHKELVSTRLLATFGILHVLNMIAQAKRNADTLEVATMVDNELRELWSGNNSKRLLLDFTSTYLHKKRDKTLGTPEFSTWANILDNFNGRYPDNSIQMIDVLLKFYDQKAIMRMLDWSKTRPKENQFATRVESELISKWQEWDEKPERLKSTLSRFSVFPKMLEEYNRKVKSSQSSSE